MVLTKQRRYDFDNGLARIDNAEIRNNTREFIARRMFKPVYSPLVDPRYDTKRPQRMG